MPQQRPIPDLYALKAEAHALHDAQVGSSTSLTHMQALAHVAKTYGYPSWEALLAVSSRTQKHHGEPSALEPDGVANPARTRIETIGAAANTNTEPSLSASIDAYLAGLRQSGLAPIQTNQVKGDIFLDLTVEGKRFQAIAADDPCITRVDGHGDCPFGVALIFKSAGWWICKYDSTQRRVSLDDLSTAGRRAVAFQFGLLDAEAPSYRRSPALMFNVFSPAYAFFRSPAASALKDWALLHPRKVKKFQPADYLLHWTRHIATGWPSPDER